MQSWGPMEVIIRKIDGHKNSSGFFLMEHISVRLPWDEGTKLAMSIWWYGSSKFNRKDNLSAVHVLALFSDCSGLILSMKAGSIKF
ncbi:hypothetical protein MTR67_038146 [Solanum verrucosum]|uniref:Uncharacterized protein n=1 Tax=Solanum verrucosum TaxID=315347 RepID=A0AAF0ZML5_SOLVR|nr:hypothetical protein MTR67_038146 [Solanum verrucosum]